ncbi:THO complex subunit 5 [Episyrphus balteatus]|uniref:THO complex subunit 5 n=1 Tax=Episyrphus balteatus TaxID=286459 RepID=UPI00248608DE|nr:THO complex subunit 5 [Episyrphus balteatus]
MDSKPHMIDTYSIKYEEKEVEKRATSLDTNLCKKKYAELGAIFEQVLKLKKDKSTKSVSELKAKRNEASLMIVLLKKVNRLEKYRIRTGREVLQKEKLRVDNNRLHLQNLLYEISYLKKEIQRCYQFTSCDEYINLVSENEFYEKAPLSISRPEATKVSEHIKRLAMLEWELQQRKELSLLCEDLVCRKDIEIKRISSTNERLESFGPSLSTLLKATKRLQSILGLDIEKEWEVNSIAKLLPQSLYMLYMKLTSFAQSFCPSLNVTVEGTEDDVRQYELTKGDEETHDYEQNSDGEEVDSKRKKHSNKSENAEKKAKVNFEPFPLFIKFTISRTEEPKGNISIEIRYFPTLGFVTAASSLNMDSLPMTEVVSSENILNYLFEADSGDTNPSLKSKYQLHEMKTNEEDCLKCLEDNKHGKPYKWVQKLCGLDFFEVDSIAELSPKPQTDADKEITVGEIIKKIKFQWSSRLNLYKQLFQLENKSNNIFMKNSNFINVSLCSSITLWAPITWEDFMQKNSQHMLSQKKFVKPGNLFYRAVITRGSMKLECFISISPNFPTKSPIWSFSVFTDTKTTASRSAAIKDMEYWTNALTQSQLKSKSSLLLSQMVRTLCSFDIFVETDVTQQKLPEFTQDKIMLKSHSKRNRGLPLKFVKNSIFKHF